MPVLKFNSIAALDAHIVTAFFYCFFVRSYDLQVTWSHMKNGIFSVQRLSNYSVWKHDFFPLFFKMSLQLNGQLCFIGLGKLNGSADCGPLVSCLVRLICIT